MKFILSPIIILLINLFFLATSFSFAVDERNLNLLLVAYMVLSISMNPFRYFNAFKKNPILVYFSLVIIISCLLNFSNLRVSSLIFSILNIAFFSFNIYLINLNINVKFILLYLKFFIGLSFVILLIQQSSFLLGYKYINFISADPGSFNVLSTEPSYASIVIFLSFYVFRKIWSSSNKNANCFYQNNLLLFIITVFCLATLGSVFGLVFLIILFFDYFTSQNLFFKFSLVVCSIFIFSISGFYSSFSNSKSFERLTSFSNVILSNDDNIFKSLVEADHSGAVRFLPFFTLFDGRDYFSIFGKGMNFTSRLMPTLINGIEDEYGGGILPAFIYDYGILCFILLVFVIKKYLINDLFDIIILSIISFNTSFNVQIFWFTMLVLSLKKIYVKYEG